MVRPVAAAILLLPVDRSAGGQCLQPSRREPAGGPAGAGLCEHLCEAGPTTVACNPKSVAAHSRVRVLLALSTIYRTSGHSYQPAAPA